MTYQFDKLGRGAVRSSFEANADALRARLAKSTTPSERAEIEREATALASSLGAVEAIKRTMRSPQSFLKIGA